MQSLLVTRYSELAIWGSANVQNDYTVSDGRNHYSVPFDLIGKQVDIRLAKTTAEVFFKGTVLPPMYTEKKRSMTRS